MKNEGYRESIDDLSDETRNMRQAIASLMEELDKELRPINLSRINNDRKKSIQKPEVSHGFNRSQRCFQNPRPR